MTTPIKQRYRRTNTEIRGLKAVIYHLVRDEKPMTVRQIFYRLVSRGIIRKDESEYKNVVCRLTAEMRKDGDLPFTWIADNTRWMRKPTTDHNLKSALKRTAEAYRRCVWDNMNCYVEIWLEKEALAGVVYDVTDVYDVPLMVTRGYSSLSFLYSAGSMLADMEKPVYIYYFGDHDPSGKDISRVVESQLREFAPDTEINFELSAVTPWQIQEYNLITRPTKKTDTRSKNFRGESVELDAIPPNELRSIVNNCIEQHITQDELKKLDTIEHYERHTLQSIIDNLPGYAA